MQNMGFSENKLATTQCNPRINGGVQMSFSGGNHFRTTNVSCPLCPRPSSLLPRGLWALKKQKTSHLCPFPPKGWKWEAGSFLGGVALTSDFCGGLVYERWSMHKVVWLVSSNLEGGGETGALRLVKGEERTFAI